MTLQYYLEQLSSSTLKKILKEHQLNDDINLPNALIELIIDRLTDLKNITDLYNKMSEPEKEVLEYFVIQIPNRTFSIRKLAGFKGRISRATFELGLINLRRKGVIFAARKSWGEVEFILPEELFLILHRFYFAKVLDNFKSEEYIDLTMEDTTDQNDTLIEEELFQFLTFCQTKTPVITQNRSINKKNINVLTKNLQSKSEESLALFPLNLKFYQENYSKKLNILLEIALKLKLVEMSDFLKITGKGVVWHNLSLASKRKYLKAIIRYLFHSTELLNQHLFYLMYSLPENKWFSFNSLLTELALFMNRPIDDGIFLRAEKEILTPLREFGWLVKVKDNKNNLYFKWEVNNIQELAQIYVQPNYEILVPKNFPHSYRVILEQFVDLHKKDQMNKYILSKESIMRGMDQGLTVTDILEFLQTHSVIPITDNIKTNISNWAENYGKISFMDVRIMNFASEKIAKIIKEQPVFKDWIIEEISPKNFVVKKENFKYFLDKLKEIGYPPKRNDILTNQNNTGNDQENWGNEDNYEYNLYEDIEVENIFPDIPVNKYC